MDFALLCKHSALRPLSEIVTEKVIHNPIPIKPGDFEQCLEDVIKSKEFARGHVASISTKFDDNTQDKVHQILSSIDFQWTSSLLQTNLSANDCNDFTVVENSQEDKLAFCQGGTLWLQNDIIDGDRERDLFDEINVSLFCILEADPQISYQRHANFPDMLGCYKEKPCSIPNVMERKGFISDNLTNTTHPGRIAPLTLHTFVKQSMLLTFDTEETVAILGEKIEHVQRYKYAKVQSFVSNPTVLEEDLGKQNYNILVEKNVAKTMKHFELYKITRNHMPSFDYERDKKNAVVEQIDTKCQFEDLVKQLRQMELCEETEYKTRVRRLMLLWHPDKNIGREKHAVTFFRTITRHSKSYNGNKFFPG